MIDIYLSFEQKMKIILKYLKYSVGKVSKIRVKSHEFLGNERNRSKFGLKKINEFLEFHMDEWESLNLRKVGLKLFRKNSNFN